MTFGAMNGKEKPPQTQVLKAAGPISGSDHRVMDPGDHRESIFCDDATLIFSSARWNELETEPLGRFTAFQPLSFG